MSKELKIAINIIIDLLLLGILVTIIYVFSNYSRDALLMKTIENSSIVELTEYRNLYEYTKGRVINKSVYIDKLSSKPGYTNNTYERVLPYDHFDNAGNSGKSSLSKMTAYFNDTLKYTGVTTTELDAAVNTYHTDFSTGKVKEYPKGLVTGSDIANFIQKYPQQYNVFIFDREGNSLLRLPRYLDLESIEGSTSADNWVKRYLTDASMSKYKLHENWTLSFLKKEIGEENINSFYFSFVVYDDFIGKFESVIFIRVGETYAS